MPATSDPVERSDAPGPIPAFSLLGSLSPLLIVPILVPVLAALFAPTDVFDLWPSTRRFASAVQHVLPFVRMTGHADSTTYPQVALFVQSISMIVLPVLTLVWLAQSAFNYPRILERARFRGGVSIKQHLLVLFVGPPLFLAILYFFIVLPGDPSFARGATTNNRGGFAVLTFFALYLTSAVLGAQLTNIRLFVDLHLRR